LSKLNQNSPKSGWTKKKNYDILASATINHLLREDIKMNKLVLASAALALVLTTGFTCSKNAPEQAAAPATTADQSTMAASATTTTSTDSTTAAPAEGTTAPATETK
jgi:hypothetical protein